MIACPNKNDKNWKYLETNFGTRKAYQIWTKYNFNLPDNITDVYPENSGGTSIDELLEQGQGDPKLDSLVATQITRLKNTVYELQSLKGANTEKRNELDLRVGVIRQAIKRLENDRTYSSIINVNASKLSEAEEVIRKPDINSEDMVFAKTVIEDLEILSEELGGSNLSEADKGRLNALRNRLDQLKVDWGAKQNEFIRRIAYSRGVTLNEDDLRAVYKDISTFKAGVLSTEESLIPELRIASAIFEWMKRKPSEIIDDHRYESQRLRKKFDIAKEVKKFIDKSGKLIGRYKPEYYEAEKNVLIAQANALKLAKTPQEKAQIYRKTYDWFIKNNKYELTSEGEDLYAAQLAAIEKAYTDVESNIVDQAAVQRWATENSPRLGMQFYNTGIFNVDNHKWYKYLKATPKDDLWKDSRFDKIADNEVYQFIVKTIMKAESLIPHRMSVDVGSFDRVLNSFLFDLNQSGEFSLKAMFAGMKDTMSNWFTSAVDESTMRGINPKIKDEKGNDKDVIRATALEDLEDEKFSDPLDMVNKFFEMATIYDHKVQSKPIIDLLTDSLGKREAIKTNIIGGAEISPEGKLLTIKEGLVRAKQQLEYKANAEFFGKFRTDENKVSLTQKQIEDYQKAYSGWEIEKEKAIKEGKPIPPKPEAPRGFSFVKASDFLVDYTRLTTLGVKPFAAISNIVIGMNSNFLWAARDKDFNDKDLFKASQIMIGAIGKYWTVNKAVTPTAKKLALLMGKFRVVDSGVLEEQHRFNDNKFVKLMYTFQTGGEYLIHGQGLVAKMLHYKIKDLKGKERPLWEAYTVVNDRLVWNKEFGEGKEWSSVEVLDEQGQNVSKLNEFWNEFKEFRKATQGDYMNAMMFKGKWYGRMLMLFRTWLPQAIHQRFGSKEGNFKGRYASYVSVANAFEGNFVVRFLKLLGYSAAKTLTSLPILNRLGLTSGIDKKLEESGVTKLDLENMRVNVREMQLIVGFVILAGMLKGLDDGDDDDSNLPFFINLAQRAWQDLSFFYSPESAQAILRDPIPVYKTINNAFDVVHAIMNLIEDPQSDIYERGIRKGQSKTIKELMELFPVAQSYQSTYSTAHQIFGSQSYKFTNK